MSTVIRSVSLSLELDNLSRIHNISLSEAARVGMAVLLSERGEPQYLNRTNIGRKVERLAEELNRITEMMEGGKHETEKKM